MFDERWVFSLHPLVFLCRFVYGVVDILCSPMHTPCSARLIPRAVKVAASILIGRWFEKIGELADKQPICSRLSRVIKETHYSHPPFS